MKYMAVKLDCHGYVLRTIVQDQKKTPGDRAFKIVAPRMWNTLPKGVRKQDNYHIL